jgi:hypothetical protein
MIMKRGTWILLAMLSTGLLVGCGDKEEETPKEGDTPPAAIASLKASTPKEALENMQKAMLNGDGDAFAACYDATAEEKEILAASNRFMFATNRFEDALKKEYGEDAAGTEGIKNPYRDENWAETFDIKIEGDTAIATPKTADYERPFRLVKKDNHWLARPENFGEERPSAEKLKPFLKQINTMMDVIKNAHNKIGQAGYTAKKINEEMLVEMINGRDVQ